MRIIIIVCIFVILASIFSCHQPLQESSTLLNGTTVTSEEKAKLDALKPDVDKILSEVLGDTIEPDGARKIKSLEQVSMLKERVTNLLKENFGDDYRKFITEKELTQTSITKAPNQSTSADQVLISNQIQKNVSGNTIIKIGEVANNLDTIYQLKVTVSTFVSPWYYFNFTGQTIYNSRWRYSVWRDSKDMPHFSKYYETVECPVNFQAISIVDQGVQYNNSIYNASSCAVIGMIVPVGTAASSVITYHYVEDPRVYNGSVWYGWQWGN